MFKKFLEIAYIVFSTLCGLAGFFMMILETPDYDMQIKLLATGALLLALAVLPGIFVSMKEARRCCNNDTL